jgi:hypothetical protein
MNRAIFITSGKGGVAKTKFARLLAEMHREQKSSVLLVDADRAVGGFVKHLGVRDGDGRLLNPQPLGNGVQVIDWHNDVRSRDEIANLLSHGRDMITDMPGGTVDGLHKLDEEAGLRDVVTDHGFKSTFVSMITPWVETWADAKKVRAWFPDAAQLLVVNHDFGDDEDFRRWTASETRSELLKSGSREIELPLLQSGIAAEIAFHRLGFFDAPTSDKLEVLDRGRAKKWLTAATAAVDQVGDILALRTKVPA